ncbi:MAG: FG-GAP repeat domain-containing protein [Candidatus Sulfotelmatobacter sp.]
MKAFFTGVLLLLTALPVFGSHAQLSTSSQFRVKHAREGQTGKQKSAKVARHWATHVPPGLQPTKPARPGATPAHIGRFSNRIVKYDGSSSSVPTGSMVAAGRAATGGESDDENEPVMGDFNGDGKKDAAIVVFNTVGQTSTYSLSVLLGKGDGTFQTAVLTDTPGNADDPIMVGDVNGDGNDDILMVHRSGFGPCLSGKKTGIQPQGGCGQSSVSVFISNGDGTFASPVNYVVSYNSLVGGVLTDINADGKLDFLAFDDSTPGNAIDLLGNGDGTFQTAATYFTLTGPAPGAMFFADFNGDGKLDFAGYSSSQLSVFLASGSGWAAPVDLTTEDGEYDGCFSTAGDLTGDGKPEIVSVNCDEQNWVTVYVNNGDGTFAPGVYYNLTGDLYQVPSEAAIGDVNGDGFNDIVVTNEDGGDISVLLGHGDGTFTAEPLNYDTGGFPWMTPLVADFNGDGLLDVLVNDDYFNLVYLQGYGDGTFRGVPTYPLPNSFDQFAWSYSVATGDFNGDGIPDLAVGQSSNDGSTGVVVYLGKGDGTFSPGVSYGESTGLAYVTVADFNGDGKLDIAATDVRNDAVQILTGNGDGTFGIGLSISTGGSDPSNIVSGDFNHDGKTDLAVANGGSGTIAVLLGNGDGSFAGAVSYPTTYYFPQYITAADIDGDGYLDLAVTAYTDGPAAVGVFLANNDNSGTFKPVAYTTLDGNPVFVAFGDLSKDGKADLAVTELDGSTYYGFVEVGLGNGDGTFGTLAAYPTSTFVAESPRPADIQVSDINGDGNLDLVYVNSGFGTVGIMYGNGDGTLNAPVEFPGNEDNYGLALADLDGDGAIDVVTANDYSGGPSVFLNGSGNATAPTYVLATQTSSATVTAGASGTYTLSLAGRNGYTGTITFSCGELPTGAKCAFSPSSVIANSGTRLETTLTISTTARTAAALREMARPGSQPGSPILLASFGGIGLVGLVFAGSGKKGRQRRAAIVLGLVMFATLGLTVACSNSNGTGTKTVASTGTPAGAYSVAVTSTGTGTNAPTRSVHVTLVVQ